MCFKCEVSLYMTKHIARGSSSSSDGDMTIGEREFVLELSASIIRQEGTKVQEFWVGGMRLAEIIN